MYFLNPVGQDNHYAHGKEAAGKAWMEELHYGPHEVLLIGDTIHDREVAESIGQIVFCYPTAIPAMNAS